MFMLTKKKYYLDKMLRIYKFLKDNTETCAGRGGREAIVCQSVTVRSYSANQRLRLKIC